MKKLKTISRIFITLSALLMISAYFTPLWRILMWAPQYPEWLGLKIWINNITGDLNTINGLNHYIGMKHIRVEMFPEFTYLPFIVGSIIAFGLVTAVINRRSFLVAYMVLLIIAGLSALVDFYLWGYDYGHNLDPTAAIQVPGMSYQPPLIGTKQLLNFTAFSGPDIGGWIFIGSALIVAAVVAFELLTKKRTTQP
jgi:copper chaperone NosL